MILSVDPGAKHCGLALWHNRLLQLAWLQPVGDGALTAIHTRVSSKGMGLDQIIYERPQIYPAMRLRGDPNDLVTVAIVGAELAGFLRAFYPVMTVSTYYPRTWKGNVKKDAHQPDILAALSAAEISNIEMPRAKALAHNTIDAIGLGLFFLGRSERGKKAGRKAS